MTTGGRDGLDEAVHTTRASTGSAADALTDDEIVTRILRGESYLFDLLYKRYYALVVHVVLAEVRNYTFAPDLVQDTFTKTWERLPTLRDRAAFRRWLAAIARNVATDHRRRRARDRRAEVDGNDQPDPRPTPERQFELDDHVRRAERRAERLPGRERTAILLASRFDCSTAEIAHAMGTTAGNAKVILHRARRRLRDDPSLLPVPG